MLLLHWLLACGGSSSPADDAPADGATTYFRDAKPIIDTKCATCHQPGDVGPFPLTTAEEVASTAALSELAVASGSMPPFLPSHDCNDYTTDFDLSEDERDLLLDFFAAGAPAGDPDDAAPSSIPSHELDADRVVTLPEAYTPVLEPDDYRCQLIDLGITEPTYVTGFQVWPDQRSIVHHTIIFIAGEDQRATYEAYDADDDGPGWTCFGGPNPEGAAEELDPAELVEMLSDPSALTERASSVRSLGGWVPGAQQGMLPEGTGVLLQPGDAFVVQMHYNTLSASPVADRSSIALTLADEVDFPASTLPLLDLAWPTGIELLGEPMDIPAGSPDASAEVVIDRDDPLVQLALEGLGVGPDETVRVHGAGVHMHQLGVDGRIDRIAADGEETCLIHYPDWDFAWQGTHFLTEAIELGPDDLLRLRCQWDNTETNQPVIDGTAQEPRDVTWGEGTTDEMCLGNLYISR
mgnify:CR=1 FL=1